MNHHTYRRQKTGMRKLENQKGIALVIVLWMLALLTILAAGYSHTMRTETLLTANLVRSAQAVALAEAGIWLGVTGLLTPPFEQTWKIDGSINTIGFNQGTINVSIQDETGKIDLNTARPELLDGLLRSVNVTEKKRLSIINAILDWRDRDNVTREEGAEDEDYQRLGYDYGAKDGSFNTMDELQLVMGMTPALFNKIKPALTIYSEQTGIQPLVAPRAALLALPGMSPERVDKILTTRTALSDPDTPMEITGIDPGLISKAKGSIFTISSEGINDNSYARLDVVVMIIQRTNLNLPYTIISWRESQEHDLQSPQLSTQNNSGHANE